MSQDILPKNDIILAIDTARERLQLCVLKNSVPDALIVDVAKGHAEIIMDKIGELLARNDLSYQDITKVAVSSGPGSFTGLRIGISVARGLGISLDVPVLGIPSLTAISLNTSGAQTLVLDAGRTECYVQHFTDAGIAASPSYLGNLAEELLAAGKAEADEFSIDIERLAIYAAQQTADNFPPEPHYIRAADAKPQLNGKVAKQ